MLTGACTGGGGGAGARVAIVVDEEGVGGVELIVAILVAFWHLVTLCSLLRSCPGIKAPGHVLDSPDKPYRALA
jgi:hypothetical protein